MLRTEGDVAAFGALSGLAPGDGPGRLLAVNDSFYGLPCCLTQWPAP
jgi:hypothetical protein